MATLQQSALVIQKQLDQLIDSPVEGFTVGLVDESNIYEWNVTVVGPPNTPYSAGLFKAIMSFPTDYPVKPPSFKFTTEIWHPNVYPDGRVCISTLRLHINNKGPCERWSPNHTAESVLLSIISMLSAPSDDSPANYTAALQWNMDKELFINHVKASMNKSQAQEKEETL